MRKIDSAEIDRIAARNYTIELQRDEDGDYVASVRELRGCVAHGADANGALIELESMKRLWIEACLQEGGTVPDVREDEDLPSGKWLQRVPRSLHKRLIECAEREGVSLNSYVSNTLASAAGVAEQMARQVKHPIENLLIGTAHTSMGSIHSLIEGKATEVGWGTAPYHLNVRPLKTTNLVTDVAQKVAVAALGHQGNPYSTFVDSLVGQLPSHCPSLPERTSREEADDYKDKVYA